VNTYTSADYRRAAEVLWGEAGAWAVDEYQRHNVRYFEGRLPPVPVVIGLTAYGRCLGLTRGHGEWARELPRISLQSGHFEGGTRGVSDTILHEMVHVRLILAGLDPSHNAKPWCAEIERLSPLVLGRAVKARPVHPRWVNGSKQRLPLDGHLTRMELATWPDMLREPSTETGQVLAVSSY
jgi:hypothetical protein